MPEGNATAKRRARRLLRPAVLALALIPALYLLYCLAVAIGFSLARGPTQVAVRNRTGEILEKVQIVLDNWDNAPTVESIGRLEPGEERITRPEKLDFSARLSFVLGGRELRHQKSVDLWNGETYAFEVQPDGTVRSGYDYGEGLIRAR